MGICYWYTSIYSNDWYNLMALQDSQPENKNFLSPVGFQFSIQKLPHVNYFCQSANIPDISLSQTELVNPFINLPSPGSQLTFGGLDVTFRVDEDLKNYKEIHNWLIGLGFPDNFDQRAAIARGRNPGKVSVGEIFSDASLLISTSAYKTNVEVHFVDAFPVSLSTVNFDIRAADIEYLEATASFVYRRYNIVDIV